jgi:hypothetical protein
MSQSFQQALAGVRANPAAPFVDTTLVIHQEDDLVLYGYGSLFYYADVSGQRGAVQGRGQIGSPTKPQATIAQEGLSSRQHLDFMKIANSADAVVLPNQLEPQPFLVGAARKLTLTVALVPRSPVNPNESIDVEVDVNGNNIVFTAEAVGNILRGVAAAPYAQGRAVYSLTFGAAHGVPN